MSQLFFPLSLLLACFTAASSLSQGAPSDTRHQLTARASEIDSRTKEHPELNFLFTDKKGKTQDLQHAIVDTAVPSRGQLVIWLMGHNQLLFDKLADYGLHAIQPHYANRWFSTIDRTQRDDGISLGKIRLEAATGEDHSPLVAIPKPDGLAERSRQFVKWLATNDPKGNWQQFLTPDGLDLQWEKVILSGISHGSTTAARFAKHQKVARVVTFSGPRDQFDEWQGYPSATPANRYFGFTHVLDGGWTGDHYCRSWQMLGLAKFGPVVTVDDVDAPYGGTRRLVTNCDVGGNAGRAHNVVVKAAKKGPNGFTWDPVWRYLFTHPVDDAGKPVPLDPDCRMQLK